ncbi:MAG: glycogen/starch/alpha-glucan phosphorylase, partial [Deltaproteobacteria bacterium]|nr:glycogen/starch/alpha-glucan phosphorylase [Deltaproteobacteria bacterium]
GANVEIRDAVGADNFFLFGLNAQEVQERRRSGYRPADVINASERLRDVLSLVASGAVSRGDKQLFSPLLDALWNWDEYMLAADFQSYVDCQQRAGELYERPGDWTRMSVLNVARMGRFSSDRTIREYCENIWLVQPVRPE